MKRERKELAVGEDAADAIAKFVEFRGEPWNPEKYETVTDSTGLTSVYHRRRATDRTIKRPISREARAPYSNGYGRDAKRPVIVTLHPRELIETRLKGTRRRYSINWDDLHALLVRRAAFAAMNAKRKERAAIRAARKQQRKRR